MKDEAVDLLDADEAVRELALRSELSGARTFLLRNGRPVAVVVSGDEYLALTETVQIVASESLRAALDAADDAVRRNAIADAEDLDAQ